MKMSIRSMASDARQAALKLASATLDKRNEALLAIADIIEKNTARLLEVNAIDVEAAMQEGLSSPLLNRLKLSESKCIGMAEGLRSLSQLPDPLGHVQYAKELSPGLNLYRVACPIGVIGVIFESRTV